MLRRLAHTHACRKGHYVLVSNHQSNFDVPLVVGTVPLQLVALAKNSLFRVPFFGWTIYAMGCISINRKDHEQAVAACEGACKFLRKFPR